MNNILNTILPKYIEKASKSIPIGKYSGYTSILRTSPCSSMTPSGEVQPRPSDRNLYDEEKSSFRRTCNIFFLTPDLNIITSMRSIKMNVLF